jgi:hypothetical protein
MRVSARNAAVVAGLIAAVYLAAVFSIRRVPDRMLGLLGGPTGIARRGGLIVRYRPPAGVDASRLERSIARHRVVVRPDAGRLVIEIPGVQQAEADDLVAVLTRGGLEFREVIDDLSLLKVPHERVGGDDFVAPGVRVSIDMWPTEDMSMHRNSAYLSADDPGQLMAAFAQLRAGGWAPPRHSVIAIERVEPWPDSKLQPDRWRSYFVGDEVLLDGDAVDDATVSVDPNTGRPIVLLDFDRAGGKRFGDITARIAGHKLATLLGGQVRSAPVINGAIRGGRASIAMGGADPARQEREAAALSTVLKMGALPPGGVIEDQTWLPPGSTSTPLALAVLIIALSGGGLVGLVIGIAIRIARPVWQAAAPRPPGRFAVKRVAVTLLAPASLLVLGAITWPGINGAELDHIVHRGSYRSLPLFSIVDLGVGPITTAFIVVELAMLMVPRWRRARLQPAARIVAGRYVAVIGVALALVQSYLAVSYLHELARFNTGELFSPSVAAYVAAMASPAAGTMLLVIVAGMIRQHGLGNGYGALLVSTWAIQAIDHVVDQPGPGHALGLVALAAIGCATVALLRMRIGDDRQAPLRLPASGAVPLTSAGFVMVLGTFALHGLPAVWGHGGFLPDPFAPGWGMVGWSIVLVPVWSFAFSRPAIVAPLAATAQIAPPGQASWLRATLLSLPFLGLISAASRLAVGTHPDAAVLGDPAHAMLLAAVVLDLVDDLRSRRGDLVVAWPLHQAQHAELVRRVLADAGIPCHLVASHLRTLLAVFGPYAPIDVLVPAGSVDDARGKIAGLYQDVAVEAFD